MLRKVEVVPHDPNWLNLFEIESKQIAIALGENIIKVHHIGSTSIEKIYAKPIIDILVEVSSLDKVDEQSLEMEALGYECMGEFGVENRRFFLKNDRNGIRTHHIHIFEVGSVQLARHIAFRNYLNSHPEDALAYSSLKRSLAKRHPSDIEGYMDGKHNFIQEIDRKAVEWQSQNQS